jgi:hypothetical protein
MHDYAVVSYDGLLCEDHRRLPWFQSSDLSSIDVLCIIFNVLVHSFKGAHRETGVARLRGKCFVIGSCL